jgi:hypothetical protein
MQINEFDLTSIPNRVRKYLTSIEDSIIDAAKQDLYFKDMNPSLAIILGHFENYSIPIEGIDWISKLYKSKKFKMEEILKYKEAIDLYFETLDTTTASSKLLFQKNSLDDVLEEIQKKFGTTSKRDIERHIKENESERIVEERGFMVIIPKTSSAAKIYGRSTKWCISASLHNEFEKHAKNGTSYILILNKRKFCMHVENKQFMNELNELINSEDIKELMASEPFLKFFREKEKEYSSHSDYFSFLAQLGLK